MKKKRYKVDNKKRKKYNFREIEWKGEYKINMIYINNKEKIEKLKQVKDYCVIMDFDRTITTKTSEPSLGVLPNYFGGEFLVERTKIFNHYRPIELDYTLEEEEKKKIMKQWAVDSFNLSSKYITKDAIDKATDNSNMYLRKGAKEFFENLRDKNIPVIIMSAGIGNIIEKFLIKQNTYFNNITLISNFFKFEDEKAIIDLDNLISTSNKNYSAIPEEIRKELENKGKILLFGDVVEDISMVNKNQLEKTITIGFLDHGEEQNLEVYNKNFDIVLTNNSDFEVVKEVI